MRSSVLEKWETKSVKKVPMAISRADSALLMNCCPQLMRKKGIALFRQPTIKILRHSFFPLGKGCLIPGKALADQQRDDQEYDGAESNSPGGDADWPEIVERYRDKDESTTPDGADEEQSVEVKKRRTSDGGKHACSVIV